MVRPRETPPGRLDLGRRGARFDAEDVVGIAGCHGSSLSGRVRLTGRRRGLSHDLVPTLRRTGVLAAIAAAPFALAYRFALIYRVRAGYPTPRPPERTPADVGLAFEDVDAPTEDGLSLPGWFVPASEGRPGPGIALIHGWESARDRLLPMIEFLNAAGFHCLAIDVRGHGANPKETLPITAGEFGTDALAAWHALATRPEVTTAAILGHSMGAIGAILAASLEPRIAAVVATSAPADPWRLTRQTFRLARLPIPDLIAYPLAWLTTRVYVRPRGHRIVGISATSALRRIERPVLLVHGGRDTVVPVTHFERLERIATGSGRPADALRIEEGHHSWLYEFPIYRSTVASFLARGLGGPLDPAEAAARADAVDARRPPDTAGPPTQVELEPGGLRSLARIAGWLPRRDASGLDASISASPRTDVLGEDLAG